MIRILKHYQRSVSKDPVIKDRKLKEEYPNPATVGGWPNTRQKRLEFFRNWKKQAVSQYSIQTRE